MRYIELADTLYAWRILTAEQAASIFVDARPIYPPEERHDWTIERTSVNPETGKVDVFRTGGREGDYLTSRGAVFQRPGLRMGAQFEATWKRIPLSIRDSDLRSSR